MCPWPWEAPCPQLQATALPAQQCQEGWARDRACPPPLSLCLSFFVPKNRRVREATSRVVWGTRVRFYLMRKERLYKKERNLIYGTVWANLENMMLSEKSRSPKTTYYILPFVGTFQNSRSSQRLDIDWWLPGDGRREHTCFRGTGFPFGGMRMWGARGRWVTQHCECPQGHQLGHVRTVDFVV